MHIDQRINVTAYDIEQGEPSECSKCPIALAMHSQLEFIRRTSDTTVEVTDDTVQIHRPGEETIELGLPGEAQQFVHDFDNGEPCSPFSFTFDSPPPKTPPPIATAPA